MALKDANENPWYILMTLHGEQPAQYVDWMLADRNRHLWNAWICQNMDKPERAAMAKDIGVDHDETIWTDEIAKEAASLFEARRGLNSELKMPSAADRIDLEEIEIRRPLSCQKFIFRDLSLSRSVLRQPADFGDAVFLAPASFNETVFDADADFTGARFVEKAGFREARFKLRTFFNSVAFGPFTTFIGARFLDQVYFTAATFDRDVLFSRAHFAGAANFYQCRFGLPLGGTKSITFANAIFDGPVSFERAKFLQLLPVLANTTLPPSTKLTAEPDHWPRPAGLLNFLTLKTMPKDQQDPAIVKASAAILRHAMARQMLPEEEHFFFRREMHAAARAEPFYKTAHIYLFEALSNFGYSIMRPLGWLALLWGMGAWVYAAKAMMGWGTAAAYSLAATFSFLGFQRLYFGQGYIEKLPIWVQVFGAAQTVLGFILLFFLGLGLRTRFRLK